MGPSQASRRSDFGILQKRRDALSRLCSKPQVDNPQLEEVCMSTALAPENGMVEIYDVEILDVEARAGKLQGQLRVPPADNRQRCRSLQSRLDCHRRGDCCRRRNPPMSKLNPGLNPPGAITGGCNQYSRNGAILRRRPLPTTPGPWNWTNPGRRLVQPGNCSFYEMGMYDESIGRLVPAP